MGTMNMSQGLMGFEGGSSTASEEAQQKTEASFRKGVSLAPESREQDLSSCQGDFPILEEPIRGRRLVYLDNAATTQKPRAVIDAIVHAYTHLNGNVHRGVHALAGRATDAYEGAREIVRDFIGAKETREVVFVRGATEAINMVAATHGRRLQPGDEIVVTTLEHHANLVPWQRVRDETGAVLKIVPVDDRGDVQLQDVEQCVTNRTKLVAFPHVSNAIGTVTPVREIVRIAHRVGALALVDGAQGVPHAAIDVQDLDCDFYAFSGHKVYGPTGIGVLYGKAALLEAMEPYQVGGDMVLSVSLSSATFNDIPYRFEAGTPNFVGAIGLGAAMRYLQNIGMDAVMRHDAHLIEMAVQELGKVDGLRIIGAPTHRAGVISFTLEGIHPQDLGTLLDQQGIAIRTGYHCSQPLVERFGLTSTARASFALYNTPADVEALRAGLIKAARLFQ